MSLTQRLIDYLNRVFDKDPKRFAALLLDYNGTGSWSISDETLTTTVSGGTGAPLSIDLTQYTIGQLVTYLARQTGYSVTLVDPSKASLSATVLLEGGANFADTDGDHLYGYTSLLWSYLDAVASELQNLLNLVPQVPAQLSTTTASGMWLDEIGARYGVARNPSEDDGQYGPRIISTVLLPKGNNIAIQAALTAATGQDCMVTDYVLHTPTGATYNSAIDHDGTHTYGTTDVVTYGLFDVQAPYDLLNGGDPTAFQNTVTALVETLRDAGTHLRALSLTAGALSDALTPPADAFGTLTASPLLADTLTAPADDNAPYAVVVWGLLDALTAPTDTADDLLVTFGYKYAGNRTYNGAITYSGSYRFDESVDGSTINSQTKL